MKAFRTLAVALLTLLAWSALASSQEAFTAGTWTKLTNATPNGAGINQILLLQDGTVMAQDAKFATPNNWYKLTPDNTGSYINGTWSTRAALTIYDPLYFASAVLPDGRVLIEGGEYDKGSPVWTTKGAIFNPRTNSWLSMTPPSGWTTIGDAQSVILPNGTLMLANCCSTQEALLSASTLTWTTTGTGKADENDEEGWTLLPNGNVLTVDANNLSDLTNSEIYNTATGTWSTGGSTIVKLDDTNSNGGGSHELGPGVLRPDGTIFYAGATTNNASYNTATGVWAAAPSFGSSLDMADAPAALLPDGNVLLDTSPGIFGTGCKFFEWDGTALNSVPGPPNATKDSSYFGHMLVLPTGQILFTDFSSDVEIYTPAGSAQSAWAPTIRHVSATLTHGIRNNVIAGTQFNGFSQGAAYGDDTQNATNFPLVRITNNATGHVFYANTHNPSTMGVATGSTLVSAKFDVPVTIETGASSLVVIANGIPSASVAVTIN
jgi:hypothetical protein